MSKADDKILAEARKRIKQCGDGTSKQRQMMLDALKFAAGDQWPSLIRANREDPTQQGGPRPCLTVNKLSQYIHQVVNDSRQNAPSIDTRPVDDKADVEVSEILDGIIRHIQDQSNAQVAYDTAIDLTARCGLGYIRVLTDWQERNPMMQDIFIKRIINPFSVYFDMESTEPDGSDARWCAIVDEIERDQFEADYPGMDPEDFDVSNIGADLQDWYPDQGKKVKIAEYFRKVEKPDTLVQLSDGTVAYKSDIPGNLPAMVTIARERAASKCVIEWYKITGSAILERSTIPTKWIPVIPVIGEEINIGDKRFYHGLVYPAMDAQMIYNYMQSAAVERVALAPIPPVVAAVGQVEDFSQEWIGGGNIKVARYNPVSAGGQVMPPPSRPNAPDVPTGFLAIANRAEQDVQTALGMYNAALGAPSNEKSGRAIMARQREADVSTFHYVDNLARSIRHVGRIIVDMIPKVYDTTRVARILGHDGEVTQARLDPSQPEAVREYQDEMGEIQKIYNPGVGTYDVTVNVGPSYTSKRQEAAEAMMQMVQAVPQLMPIIGDLMIRNMDWPGADDIADRLKKTLPPNLQDKEEGDGGESPEMAQLKQQVQQVMEGAASRIEQLTAELETAKSGDRYKEIELQLQKEKIDLDRYKVDLAAVMQQEQMAHDARMKLAMAVNQNKHDIDMVEAKTEADIAKTFATQGAVVTADVETGPDGTTVAI